MGEELKAAAETRESASGAEEARRFSAADVRKILIRNGWMAQASEKAETAEENAWLERAATLLGAQAESEHELEELLRLAFHYDANEVVGARENQDVLTREGARDVIRELANRALEGGDVDSDRFKEIVEELKRATPWRSRELFQPIRVALAGRAGEGGLDRVILLLDSGAKVGFATPVKSVRQRMIEFCAAVD
jgi:glutamyl/glutaminyl-tRNA synthetase